MNPFTLSGPQPEQQIAEAKARIERRLPSLKEHLRKRERARSQIDRYLETIGKDARKRGDNGIAAMVDTIQIRMLELLGGAQ